VKSIAEVIGFHLWTLITLAYGSPAVQRFDQAAGIVPAKPRREAERERGSCRGRGSNPHAHFWTQDFKS
jgi:hypothetical protein